MKALSAISGLWRVLFSANKGAAAVVQTLATRFLIVGINICTGVLTARGLGPNGRGDLSAMVLWPALLAYLLTLGLPTAIRYCVRTYPEKASEFLTVSLYAAIATSTIAIVTGMVFLPTWLHNFSPETIRLSQLLMFSAPEVMIALMLTAMIEALNEFQAANTIRYVPAALTLIILVLLTLTRGMTPFSAALAYTIPPILPAFWMVWKVRHYLLLKRFDPRPAIRSLSAYGLRSYGIDLLGAMNAQIDQVLVVGLLTASQVGVYVVALSASRVMTVLSNAVVTVLFSSAAGLSKDAIIAMVGRSARMSTFLAVLFGIVLAALYPLLIPLLYGKAFFAAIIVAQILTLEAILVGLVSVLAQAFMALGRPGYITTLQFLGLAIVFPTMLVLIPRFGLIGAALALLTSTLTRLVLIFCSYPIILNMPVPSPFPTKDDFKRVREVLGRA